jgi:hypothetical protein
MSKASENVYFGYKSEPLNQIEMHFLTTKGLTSISHAQKLFKIFLRKSQTEFKNQFITYCGILRSCNYAQSVDYLDNKIPEDLFNSMVLKYELKRWTKGDLKMLHELFFEFSRQFIPRLVYGKNEWVEKLRLLNEIKNLPKVKPLKFTIEQKRQYFKITPGTIALAILTAKKIKHTTLYNHKSFEKCMTLIRNNTISLKHVTTRNRGEMYSQLKQQITCKQKILQPSKMINHTYTSKYGDIRIINMIKGMLKPIETTPIASEFTSLGITFNKPICYLMEKYNCDYRVLKDIDAVEPMLWYKKGKYVMSQCIKAVYIISKQYHTKHFITFLQKLNNCPKGLKRTYKYTYWYVFGEELHLASRFHKDVKGKTLPKQCLFEDKKMEALDYEIKELFENAILEVLNIGIQDIKKIFITGAKRIKDIESFSIF